MSAAKAAAWAQAVVLAASREDGSRSPRATALPSSLQSATSLHIQPELPASVSWQQQSIGTGSSQLGPAQRQQKLQVGHMACHSADVDESH